MDVERHAQHAELCHCCVLDITDGQIESIDLHVD